jgi:hypothetical protein
MRAVKISTCARPSDLYSLHHFETHHPPFWTDLSFLEVTKLKYRCLSPLGCILCIIIIIIIIIIIYSYCIELKAMAMGVF